MAKLLGNVDLLGLNQFGENPGMNPIWGVLIGGSVSGVTAAALERSAQPGGTAQRNADLIGFLTGVATGGVMYTMKSTRHAAFGTIAGAFFASGLKWLVGALLGTPGLPAAAPKPGGTAGMGLPMIQNLNGLGLPMIQNLNGQMGLPSVAQTPHPHGTIPGVAGPQFSGGNGMGAAPPPVHLLGHQLSAGGPMISGLSARYGATLLGQR